MTASISVIIPSNLSNRLEMLKRSLNFLYRNGFTGEVIVGVWGGHEHIDALARWCQKLSLNISVLFQDGDESFTTRALELAEFSTGTHIIQIGDDDYLIPSALENMAAALSDPAVFAAQGRTLSVDKHLGFYSFPMWPALEEQPAVRLANYFTHSGQTFHAMLRRHDFIEKMRLMDEAMRATKNHVWFEIIGEFYILIKGRFVILDDVFILRGKHTDNTSRNLLKDKSDDMFPYLLLSGDFSRQYKFFEGQVMALFGDEPPRSIQDAIVRAFGAIIYGIRGPISPEETALRERLPGLVPHFIEMIHAAN